VRLRLTKIDEYQFLTCLNQTMKLNSPAVRGRTAMRTLWNCVARFQTTAIRSVPLVLYAVLVIVLAGGCAHQRERAATPGASQPTASPWALPTSTMR
jgi:hypothetical protein